MLLFFFFHVVSILNMIKGKYNLVSWSLSHVYRSCGSGDEILLIYNVALCDPIIKNSITLWVQSLTLRHSYAKLDAFRSYGSGHTTSLFCNMTSCDHIIKGTCDLVFFRAPNPKSPPCQIWTL